MKILNFLKEKNEVDLDAPATTLQHREIILRKSFLKKIYIRWYSHFLKALPALPEGPIVEIGSGGGFLKTLCPQVITSDILDSVNCDMTFSAEAMPFENNSVSGIFMIDVLHHIPDSKAFFNEATRVLKPGGKIIMIEPANTLFSRFIYKNLHHENFDPDTKVWEFATSGPLSGANGALPWIIFRRDYALFKKLYPALSCTRVTLHTPFAYLVSGGLTLKSLLPGMLFPLFNFFEIIISPLNRWVAMFQTIEVRKE